MNKEEEQIRKKSPVSIRNKKASFEYFFVDTYTAGIVLTGTEIKSIRLGKASLVDSYCYIHNIHKLQEATKQVGFTIVPTLVFIDAKGRAKVDIALVKGKKEYDKRQTLKEKEDRREMDRAMKHY